MATTLGQQVILGLLGGVPLLVGLFALRSGWRRWRLVRRMTGAEAEPVDVADVSGGTTAVEGTARVSTEPPVTAPFTDDRALVAIGETRTPSRSGDGTDSLTTDERAVESVSFVVEDGSGSIAVDPDGGTFHLRASRFGPDEVEAAAVDAWADRTGVEPGQPNGYRQRLLSAGDRVYVYGTAVRADEMAAKGGESGVDWQLTGGDDLVVSTEGRAQLGGNNLVVAVLLFLFGGMFTLMGLLVLSSVL